MRVTLIIAAGGSGTRFGKTLRGRSKLFCPLQDKPLLAHSLLLFQQIPQIKETIIALPPGMAKQVRLWIREYGWRSLTFVQGGKTRAESVWRALKKSNPKNKWVMVHDGARPLLPISSVEKLMASVQDNGVAGAILAKKVVPTIKLVNPSKNEIKETVDRQFLYEAETPQLVRREVIQKAYKVGSDAFEATDEAALLESIGTRVKVVRHEAWNPKITTLQDMQLAEAFLSQHRAVESRVGLGLDTHRLVSGRKLYLGGVRVPSKKGALGHSDGDVLLHAISDAVLGVLGAGDIGDWFSDKNPRFKNIRSEKILRTIIAEAEKKHWFVSHVDTVIILEKPKLGKHKIEMRKKIAKLVHLPFEAVSVKAKTAEGLGPEGSGSAVSCKAIVSMKGKAS